MKARRLVLSGEAIDDIAERGTVPGGMRGSAFAHDWADVLMDWLEACAAGGAQIRAEPPSDLVRTWSRR